MKITAHWSWDARLVGTGDRPETDKHTYSMKGKQISRLTLAFPIDNAYVGAGYNIPWQDHGIKPGEIPLLAVSRISLDMEIE